jgi:hypothetical protein
MTAIESDSDLMALKYTLRNEPMALVAQYSKSKHQIMQEVIS